MSLWCDNCGMGTEGIEGCPGYSKLAHKDCALYLPMRLDGTVDLNLIPKSERS